MANDHPALICRLEPISSRTALLWKHAHNTSRYVGPSFTGSDDDQASYHEQPSPETDPTRDSEPDEEPAIELKMTNLPKNPNQGYVFGSDQRICDVYCGRPEPEYKICSQTFSININRDGEVALYQRTDRTFTAVKYGDQHAGYRRKFKWILFPGKPIIVTVAKKLSFRVWVPPHKNLIRSYKVHLHEYNEACHSAVLLDHDRTLGRGRQTATDGALISNTNENRFWYHCPEPDLGKGSFARVFKVRDASTGETCAAKQYLRDFYAKETQILSQLNHVSLCFRLDGLAYQLIGNSDQYSAIC